MDTTMAAPALFSLAAAKAVPNAPGRLSAEIFRHGTLELRWYAPKGVDAQVPHTRDEVYVVITGSGWFVRGAERFTFGPGDALFVAAGVVHRFEDFSDDIGCWVVFYGPEGGEAHRKEG
jgi:mannose-6-phosphate isomerase-like protein (cupin superfamily)